MSRFLERQLRAAESKKLGRDETTYDPEKNEFTRGRADASKRPQNVVRHAIPDGRRNGVVKPGD